MSGFDTFRSALPDPLLRLCDPGGAVADDAIRQALSLAIGGLMLALLVRIGLRLGAGLWHRIRRETVVQPTSRPLRIARGIAGFAAIGLPWAALLALHELGRLDDGWFRASALAGWVWLLLRAADHHRLLLDLKHDAVVVRSGLAVGPLESTVWPVVALLAGVDGSPLPPVTTRPRGLEVVPRRAAWHHLVTVLGSESAAEAWLKLAIRKLALRPAKAWRPHDDA